MDRLRHRFLLISTWLVVMAGLAVSGPNSISLTTDWRFQPDPSNIGMEEGWSDPGWSDRDWTRLRAGSRWEDQGFRDMDGFGWYRKPVEVPTEWRGLPIWLGFGSVNDACLLFCNGEEVRSFGEREEVSMADSPLLADLTDYLEPGETNLIALRVEDFGGSGGLWRGDCLLTTDPILTPQVPASFALLDYENSEILIDLDLRGLGKPRSTLNFSLQVRPVDSKSGFSKTIPVPEKVLAATAGITIDDPEKREVVNIVVNLFEPNGKPAIPAPIQHHVVWDSQPDRLNHKKGHRVLNHLVTELLSVRSVNSEGDVAFANPRSGWIFISLESDVPAPVLKLDQETEPVVFRANPESRALETMRFLSEGEHILRVTGDGPFSLAVRAIPELSFCYYPSSNHLKHHGSYDLDYMNRYIFPNINTIITHGSSPPREELMDWVREGRRIVSNHGLPGLGGAAPSADEVLENWKENPGFFDPNYGGIIVDEFVPASGDHYRAWKEAVARLSENERFEGKTFYAFCTDLYRIEDTEVEGFCRTIQDLNHLFAWEKYFPEGDTPERNRLNLLRSLQGHLTEWESRFPGSAERVVIVLGYLSAPPESLNVNPGVNYLVHMEDQFRALALDPTFSEIAGVMEYMAGYADEEAVRWACRLFRHYCIKGERERLSHDPYLLSHVQNPDFQNGLKGWEITPAEPDSIRVETREGYSWLQGRYPRTSRGDRFLVLERSREGGNEIRQRLRNLDPDRWHSLKVLSSYPNDLDKETLVEIEIEIEGAQLDPSLSFSEAYPSSYSHSHGPFNRENRAWFTYHRLVFKPSRDEAHLSIKDGEKGDGSEGQPFQEIAVNFVEVQPYLHPQN